MRGNSEASGRTQEVPRTAGSQEGMLWGPQRHATCSGSSRCWTGREEEGLGRAGLRLPREAGRGSLSHAHSGAAFVHRLLTFPCRVTAHTDRRPTGSSVISHPPTERSLKGSGSCWGSSSEGI